MSVCWCTPLVRGHVHQERPAKKVAEARSKVGDSQEGVHPKKEEKICSENQVKNLF